MGHVRACASERWCELHPLGKLLNRTSNTAVAVPCEENAKIASV
jgi:hypothetical protein